MKKLFLILLIFSCRVKEPVQNLAVLSYSSPEAEGVSSRGIIDFIDAVESEQPDEVHSMMILRHGKIISEGGWSPYGTDSPHLLYSLSKSFTSTAVGLAVQEGLISLYDPVISFFPEEAPQSPSNNLENMRIIDLLRMTTGHATDSFGRIQGYPEGWAAGFLSLPVEHKPGTIFIYNTGATYMLSAIIQKVTGQTLTEYLEPRLFEPLEIETPYWQSDPEGINLGGTGLYVTTRDIAKFGQMYLQKGKWKDQQILNEDWINTATSLQTSNGSNPESDWDQGYGFQFWMCRFDNYRGDGAFGQYCIVMPEKDAVIAITSGTDDMQGVMNLVWEYLLPAMQEKALPPDEAETAALNERLQNLKLSFVQGEANTALASELSGKKFMLDTNNLGVEAIEFNLNDDQRELIIWNELGEQHFPVGYNETKNGKFGFANQPEWATAASGAWVADNHYRAKVYNRESPHAVTFDFLFDGERVKWDSELNVSFGPKNLPQMTGKAEL